MPGAVASVVATGGAAHFVGASGLEIALRNLVVLLPGGRATWGIRTVGDNQFTDNTTSLGALTPVAPQQARPAYPRDCGRGIGGARGRRPFPSPSGDETGPCGEGVSQECRKFGIRGEIAAWARLDAREIL